MIGHGLGAAGGLEAIAVVKAIQTGTLHPTLNQDNLEEARRVCSSIAEASVLYPLYCAIIIVYLES